MSVFTTGQTSDASKKFRFGCNSALSSVSIERVISTVLASLLLQQRPTFSTVEARLAQDLKAIGGKLVWVNESDDDWELCLDVELGKQRLDFGVLSPLKRLAVLRVFQGSIKEDSLVALEPLKDLNLLVILSNGLTDKGMALIGNLTGLKKLDVKGSITAKGLTHLKRLPHLKRLFLYNTRIKDSDLKELESLKSLDEVTLPMTVSRAGIDRLRRKLPNVHIERI